MDSPASSQALLNNFHGRILSSLQPTTCLIYGIKNIYFLNDDLTQMPFHIRGIGGGISSISGGTGAVDGGLELAGQVDLISGSRASAGEGGGGEEVCAVCLEPISIYSPNCLTTCCNHTFHTSCLLPLESSQCPVCRYFSPSLSNSLSLSLSLSSLSRSLCLCLLSSDLSTIPRPLSPLAQFVLISRQSLTQRIQLTHGFVLFVASLVVVHVA
jgi:hypothetical protein